MARLYNPQPGVDSLRSRPVFHVGLFCSFAAAKLCCENNTDEEIPGPYRSFVNNPLAMHRRVPEVGTSHDRDVFSCGAGR